MQTTTQPSERVGLLPPLHAGQKVIRRSRARFKVARCGRRWGKTRYGVIEDTERMSRGKACWWVAPTYKLARGAWRTFVRLAAQMPDDFDVLVTDKRIEQKHGPGFVEVHSSDDPQGLRSQGLDHATLDEFAFGKREVWTEAIRPALTDRKGSALFISTPYGKNHFFHLYQRAAQDESGEWAAFHFPSVSNPFLDPAEIEAARNEIPERAFRQEYLAEFLDDGGEVFRRVREAATGVYLERGLPGRRYVYGVDWGKLDDFTVITVIDDETGAVVAQDRFNQIDYTVQVARLVALTLAFPPLTILAEKNSMGEPLIEKLLELGLPVQAFTTTAASKKRIIDALSLAFERGDITIPNDDGLIEELEAFGIERLPGGSLRMSAPHGAHDDRVMSLALAWDAARGGTGEHDGFLRLIRAQNAEREEAEKKAEEERRRNAA